ncbi:hypothetical protein, partial [Massilia sp.]|uniref:hypothetical protein n=1 Tax=Massilia sp. TaxID=1882437 RepID=UPI0028ADF559
RAIARDRAPKLHAHGTMLHDFNAKEDERSTKLNDMPLPISTICTNQALPDSGKIAHASDGFAWR